MIRSTEPRHVANRLGWSILEQDGVYWVPCQGRVENGVLTHTFPDNFSSLVAAIDAIDAHGKSLADTQG